MRLVLWLLGALNSRIEKDLARTDRMRQQPAAVWIRKADFDAIDEEGGMPYVFRGDRPGEDWVRLEVVLGR
jgi:hypothetical protein